MKYIPSLFSFIGDPMFGVKTKLESENFVKSIQKNVPSYRTVVLVGDVISNESGFSFLKKILHKTIVVVDQATKELCDTKYKSKIPDNVMITSDFIFKFEGYSYNVTPKPLFKFKGDINIHGSTYIVDESDFPRINVNINKALNRFVSIQEIDTGSFR